LEVAKAFPETEFLKIGPMVSLEDWTASFQCMDQITDLVIEAPKVGDDQLKGIANLKALDLLTLNDTAITDKSAESFANLSMLKYIEVKNTRVGDLWLSRILESSDRVEWLDISNTHVTDVGLHSIPPGLKRLYADGLPITDVGLSQLLSIRGLRFLSLSGSQVTGKELSEGEPVESRLVELSLYGSKIETMELLANCSSLSLLDLRNTNIGERTLEICASLPLRELHLDNSRIGPGTLKQTLKRFQQIRLLSLDNTSVNTDDLSDLPSLPNLMELYCRNTQLDDRVLPHIIACKSLTAVTLAGSQVSEEGIKDLKRRRPELSVKME
jgi:Leucine-rich repeat (LRR) protein